MVPKKESDGFRYYGTWAGNPNGIKEDTSRCIYEVWESGRSFISHQCSRKRGYGIDGVFCKQHAKLIGEEE